MLPEVNEFSFTVHAVNRFCERIRDFDDAWSARVEMMRCLSAADPSEVKVIGESIRVTTGCCVFVFVGDRYANNCSLVGVTVLPLPQETDCAEAQEEDRRTG